jgi:hypothetical protein
MERKITRITDKVKNGNLAPMMRRGRGEIDENNPERL